MLVIKRNGEREVYNLEKIKMAMNKAFIETIGEDEEKLISLSSDIHNIVYINDPKAETHIESIQNEIVNLLLEKETKVAEAYIKHRHEREILRKKRDNAFGKVMDIMKNGSKENANKPSNLSNVKRDLMAGELHRYEWAEITPEVIVQAHRDKWLHVHDTDYKGNKGHPITNCAVINLDDMLENGTKINNASIEPPKSIGTAATISSQIVPNVSNSEYGGVSFDCFNYTLAKYAELSFHKNLKDYCEVLEIDYELAKGSTLDKYKYFGKKRNRRYKVAYEKAKKKTKKDIYDACQTFEYQANSISSANQTPFSTISFGIPRNWAESEIMKAYYQVRRKGLGARGDIAIFPKLNHFIVKEYNVDKGSPHRDTTVEAAKTVAKALFPDMLIVSKEDWEEGKFTTRMGCRSRPSDFKDPKTGKYMRTGRFNYGVTSQNLPKIALETLRRGGGVEEFFEVFEESAKLMELAILDNFNFVKNMKAKHAPILFQYGGISRLDPEDSIEPLLRSKQSSISYGYFGLDDVVRILFNDEELDEHTEFAHRLMQRINDKADEIAEKYDLPVSVYGTPAESLIHTAFVADERTHGDIMPGWLKERAYYTNSYHYSSEKPIEAFEKLEIESQFVKYSQGGNINYSEVGVASDNIETIFELIEAAIEYGIQYQGFNTVNDKCHCCGFEGKINYNLETLDYQCPHCGNKDNLMMTIIKRLCGYLSNCNERQSLFGRMKEIENRTTHI